MAGRRRGTAGTFASTTIANDPQRVCDALHSAFASPCNAQVATPLSTHVWCLGLNLEVTYTHGMEPRFQALSGREFKQGMDNYVVLAREPSQEELVGTMDIQIALAKYCPGANASSTKVEPFVVARTNLQSGSDASSWFDHVGGDTSKFDQELDVDTLKYLKESKRFCTHRAHRGRVVFVAWQNGIIIGVWCTCGVGGRRGFWCRHSICCLGTKCQLKAAGVTATAGLQPHVGTLALNNEAQAAVSRGDPSHFALLSPERLTIAAGPQRPLTQRSASEPEEKRAYNMCKQAMAFALSAAAQSKNPVEQLQKLHTACLQFGSECGGTRANPVAMPAAAAVGRITNPAQQAATGRHAHSTNRITQGSPHALSSVVLKQSHQIQQLQQHNQMLCNMVPTCKPVTAATGTLQGPSPVVAQVTLVAFDPEKDVDPGMRPKKKRKKKK